uniref:Uncharacterized protein n=2 Tax=Rhizophora mucronata TaxID=61149 RepID=A0A2P2J7M9_RHIMU
MQRPFLYIAEFWKLPLADQASSPQLIVWQSNCHLCLWSPELPWSHQHSPLQDIDPVKRCEIKALNLFQGSIPFGGKIEHQSCLTTQ